MWGSDFPHPDGVWPDSQEFIAREMAGVDPRIQAKVLWQNAARLYGLPPRTRREHPHHRPGGRLTPLQVPAPPQVHTDHRHACGRLRRSTDPAATGTLAVGFGQAQHVPLTSRKTVARQERDICTDGILSVADVTFIPSRRSSASASAANGCARGGAPAVVTGQRRRPAQCATPPPDAPARWHRATSAVHALDHGPDAMQVLVRQRLGADHEIDFVGWGYRRSRAGLPRWVRYHPPSWCPPPAFG